MQFTFEAEIWEENGQYVGRANPFNIMTCGRTKTETQQALVEAVELFLETAQDMGTLDDILAESGYESVADEWVLTRQPERSFMALEF